MKVETYALRPGSSISGLVAILASSLCLNVSAAATPEEARQLDGAVLTALGAEKAGNKDGTIPAYSGEGVTPSSNYDPKQPMLRPNPFGNEKPLFSITAQNAAQYADRIDKMTEVFKRYPSYRMDIYPSHRTVMHPEWINKNTVKNATSCKAIDNELKLEGCYGGIPFPIPKTGNQVMWNHLLAYSPPSYEEINNGWIVPTSGQPVMGAGTKSWVEFPFFDRKATSPAATNSVFWKIRFDYTAPSRSAGEKYVLMDNLDNISIGRRAYAYIPGQRRVKLAPDLNYDTPSPTSGGVLTMDDGKVYLGPLDRYDWALVGKKEKYIPYNNFQLADLKDCVANKVLSTKNFPNPDCIRWELHRVWVVKGTLKPGYRHIYKTRIFYWDEDGYGTGMGENYDASGALYRVALGLSWPFYATEKDGGGQYDNTANMDLQTGYWCTNGFASAPGSGWYVTPKKEATFFTPETLAAGGIR
jgi:hypothetical protein